MLIIKDVLYIIFIIPPLFLAIFVLYLAIKEPQLIRKSTSQAGIDRPNTPNHLLAILGIVYALDELKKNNKYRTLYYIGVIGSIGMLILVLIIFILQLTYVFFPQG